MAISRAAADIAAKVNRGLPGPLVTVASDHPSHAKREAKPMRMPKPDHHDFDPCPAGNQFAVCCRLIDLGTQETSYQGKPRRQRKVYIEFQVPGERTADGEPHTVGNRYTFSSSEKATLRKHLESWRGRKFTDEEIAGFDLRNILGTPACLSIVHTDRNGSTYADIASVGGLPKGATPPTLEGETAYLSLEPDAFDSQTFESLSGKLRETIASSPEYQALQRRGVTTADPPAGRAEHEHAEDVIPF